MPGPKSVTVRSIAALLVSSGTRITWPDRASSADVLLDGLSQEP